MNILLQIHFTGFLAVTVTYCVGSIGDTIVSVSRHPGPVARALAQMYLWVLPFVWVYDLSYVFVGIVQGELIAAGIFIALACVHYLQWKKSGDDRWKKVRRKISAKVALTGDGRLTVVPT